MTKQMTEKPGPAGDDQTPEDRAPPSEKGHLRFWLFGIPITIEPSFWFITILLGAGGDNTSISVIAWVLAVTISIIVHELGHGMTANYFGAPPEITLHSMGGLTRHGRLASRGQDMLVIAAGPGAGFLFIGLIFLGMKVAGMELLARTGVPWVSWVPFDQPFLQRLMKDLAYINIGWGLINLFPVLPLDGGLLTQHVLEVLIGPRAITGTLIVSTVVAAGTAAFYYFQYHSVFMLMMFGYFAFISGKACYEHLTRPRDSGPAAG